MFIYRICKCCVRFVSLKRWIQKKVPITELSWMTERVLSRFCCVLVSLTTPFLLTHFSDAPQTFTHLPSSLHRLVHAVVLSCIDFCKVLAWVTVYPCNCSFCVSGVEPCKVAVAVEIDAIPSKSNTLLRLPWIVRVARHLPSKFVSLCFCFNELIKKSAFTQRNSLQGSGLWRVFYFFL